MTFPFTDIDGSPALATAPVVFQILSFDTSGLSDVVYYDPPLLKFYYIKCVSPLRGGEAIP